MAASSSTTKIRECATTTRLSSARASEALTDSGDRRPSPPTRWTIAPTPQSARDFRSARARTSTTPMQHETSGLPHKSEREPPSCPSGRAPAASSAAQDCCIRRTLQKSAGARTATPSRRGDSGRRSVGRSSSERRGDVVLAQPQRRGAQQAAIAAPSRPGSAEQPSVLPTPRCCSRPKLSGAPALNRATRATIALSVAVGKTSPERWCCQLIGGITETATAKIGDITPEFTWLFKHR